MINSWKQFIDTEIKKDYYQSLIKNLKKDAEQFTIFPQPKDIFSAFKLTPLDKIKVVILGQDCYHNPRQAHGLAFSVQPGIDIPPSLQNIFKEIKTDLDVQHKFQNGCLQNWAKQGVLLLNSILTVRQNQPGSHKNFGWQEFTNNAITLVNSLDRPIVYLLWGNFAREKKKLINNPKHLILESAHPSPLSAYNGFFGCRHFSKANKFLSDNNIEPISWLI